MKFTRTPLNGAFIIEFDKHTDQRGFFARSFCENEFKEYGLNPNISQCNVSFNQYTGTLRGMHYQREPNTEAKLVRCTQGAVYDVIVDIRSDSDTRFRWFSVELTSTNRTMLYIPEGFAHGFQTLVDSTEMFYQMSAPYCQNSAVGLRWNDPLLNIEWPYKEPLISEKDASYPDFDRLNIV